MTLGAGDPRSYRGARFPGIPGLSGLSSQSHGPLKVDRTERSSARLAAESRRARLPDSGLARPQARWSKPRGTSPSFGENSVCNSTYFVIVLYHAEICVYLPYIAHTSLLVSFFPVYFVLAIKSNSLIISRAEIFYSFRSSIFTSLIYKEILLKKNVLKINDRFNTKSALRHLLF